MRVHQNSSCVIEVKQGFRIILFDIGPQKVGTDLDFDAECSRMQHPSLSPSPMWTCLEYTGTPLSD